MTTTLTDAELAITPEEFTTHLNQLRAGIEEDKLVFAQFNDPISPEVVVLDTLVRSYDENAALRERVEALEWLVECMDNYEWCCNRSGWFIAHGVHHEAKATLDAAREAVS